MVTLTLSPECSSLKWPCGGKLIIASVSCCVAGVHYTRHLALLMRRCPSPPLSPDPSLGWELLLIGVKLHPILASPVVLIIHDSTFPGVYGVNPHSTFHQCENFTPFPCPSAAFIPFLCWSLVLLSLHHMSWSEDRSNDGDFVRVLRCTACICPGHHLERRYFDFGVLGFRGTCVEADCRHVGFSPLAGSILTYTFFPALSVRFLRCVSTIASEVSLLLFEISWR